MDGIAFTAYGGPEVTSIAQFPIPQPGPGEVQIRTAGSGLNPIDKHQRSGAFKSIMPYHHPVIAGNEFSGHISALGSGVDGSKFAVGDAVICRVRKDKMDGMGAYVVQPASIVAKAPSSISLVDAAGLPLAGLTALQVLNQLDVQAGDRLLITGGSGGVGLFAIQLAKIRGAYVFTTASSAGKPYVEKAGADEVIDYKTEKLASYTPKSGAKWTKVFDAAGGEQTMIDDIIPSVAPGGHIVSVAGVMTPGIFDAVLPYFKAILVNAMLRYKAWSVTSAAASAGVKYEYIFMRPDGAELAQLARYVDEGKLVVNVDSKFSVQEYKKAFEQLESGRSKGKVLIEWPQA